VLQPLPRHAPNMEAGPSQSTGNDSLRGEDDGLAGRQARSESATEAGERIEAPRFDKAYAGWTSAMDFGGSNGNAISPRRVLAALRAGGASCRKGRHNRTAKKLSYHAKAGLSSTRALSNPIHYRLGILDSSRSRTMTVRISNFKHATQSAKTASRSRADMRASFT